MWDSTHLVSVVPIYFILSCLRTTVMNYNNNNFPINNSNENVCMPRAFILLGTRVRNLADL